MAADTATTRRRNVCVAWEQGGSGRSWHRNTSIAARPGEFTPARSSGGDPRVAQHEPVGDDGALAQDACAEGRAGADARARTDDRADDLGPLRRWRPGVQHRIVDLRVRRRPPRPAPTATHRPRCAAGRRSAPAATHGAGSRPRDLPVEHVEVRLQVLLRRPEVHPVRVGTRSRTPAGRRRSARGRSRARSRSAGPAVHARERRGLEHVRPGVHVAGDRLRPASPGTPAPGRRPRVGTSPNGRASSTW